MSITNYDDIANNIFIFMKFTYLTIAILAVMGVMGVTAPSGASTIELYVDNETKQLYAEPGPNRTKLGTFQRVDEATGTNQLSEAKALEGKLDQKTRELDVMEARIDQKQIEAMETKAKPVDSKGILPSGVSYGNNGFEFKTDNGKFALAIQNRIQTRYANPFDSDPRTLNDLDREQSSFMIRRARTKLKGHAYWPWLKFYLQYDWADPVLRDLNLTVAKFKWASLELGRGKVIYNAERKTSSGNQQFVNRSIVNSIFTVDRQQGAQLYGNLFPGTWHDVTYYLGVFSGMGVGERNNDDDGMMYNARLQWNALGGEMPFSQSDIEFHEQPVLNFAIAANTNKSRCLTFATNDRSCRAMPWEPFSSVGKDGQYRTNQLMGEIRLKWQGFSLSHEMHWKEIKDKLAAQDSSFKETTMLGGLVQVGYFPHHVIPLIPMNLEFAGRYAFVDPNLAENNIQQQEISGVMTYFLNGHSSKVSFQVSHLTLDPNNSSSRSDQRFWAQWDLSF